MSPTPGQSLYNSTAVLYLLRSHLPAGLMASFFSILCKHSTYFLHRSVCECQRAHNCMQNCDWWSRFRGRTAGVYSLPRFIPQSRRWWAMWEAQFSNLEPADVLYVRKGPVATEMGCGWLNISSEKHSGSTFLPNLAFLPKSFTKLWLQFVWLVYRLSVDTNAAWSGALTMVQANMKSVVFFKTKVTVCGSRTCVCVCVLCMIGCAGKAAWGSACPSGSCLAILWMAEQEDWASWASLESAACGQTPCPLELITSLIQLENTALLR